MTGGSSNKVLISNLDLCNSLHLNSNDFSVSTIISVELTRIENYRVWATAMKLAIHTRNKTGFIDGTCKKNDYESSVNLANKWKRCNVIVLSCLLNYVSEDLEDVPKHDQLMKLMQFIMRLNDVYQPIRGRLLTKKYLPTVKDAYTIVSMEEFHIRIPSSSTASVFKSQISSFVSRTNFSNTRNSNGFKRFDNKKFNNNGNTGGNNRGPNLNLSCKNCSKVGHTIERCFDIIGYPPGYIKPSPKPGIKSSFNANANADISQCNSS
ncbi:ribonuclease H-like domain-containing protein [Tanacetum coccineum]